MASQRARPSTNRPARVVVPPNDCYKIDGKGSGADAAPFHDAGRNDDDALRRFARWRRSTKTIQAANRMFPISELEPQCDNHGGDEK